ncbi:WD40-repeat-containing domain protein [Radiomyces spectabilis]|uniref:WD40-repeat-containing domain protein n=1 Tax=Radiomyces spectabilis TaxID=64574 RepID=UPI00221E9F2F|nr:WD40-repeat-containing domain protein [Radiomyces spectabilis]KAI8366841.1 WD40-repeat-containing domain protein [Radiomyces spectabilis]
MAGPPPQHGTHFLDQARASVEPHSTQWQNATPLAHQPSQSDLDQIMTAYFQRKGYRRPDTTSHTARGHVVSLEQIRQELHPTENVPGYVRFMATAEQGNPDAYANSYRSLREWVENALDIYKPELAFVLFPMFVYSYLDLIMNNMSEQAHYFMETFKQDHMATHSSDITTFASLIDPQHVQDNAIAQLYLNNKYHLQLSAVPLELLVNYLQDNKFRLLLRIYNQHLNIQVTQDKLKSAGGLEVRGPVGILGHTPQPRSTLHPQDDTGAATDHELQDREDGQRIDKSSSMYEDTVMMDSLKEVKQEYTADSPSLPDVPIPHQGGMDVEAEIATLKELGKKVRLTSAALPSVCAYTFYNTHDNLHCLSMTQDASLIAGGFSESFIKIWSLKGEKLRSRSRNHHPSDAVSRGKTCTRILGIKRIFTNKLTWITDIEENGEASSSKRLIAHAGPVYGVSFSYDNEYLISCSEDKTVRLWSTETFDNLVCYKGHNYPVWDVDFGPLGFYFATASHDRTARLWTCDRVHPLRIFAGHLSDVDTVKFHPNSKYIVTGSADRTARLWDVQRGTCVRVFTGHQGSIKTVAISPNGRLMASAGEDRSIILWDLGSGRKLKTMTGHTDFIYSVDFSSDSNVLVSGGADGTVRVWDVNKDVSSLSNAESSKTDAKRIRVDDKETDSSKKKDAKSKSKIEEKRETGTIESSDHMAVLPTKHTPIYKVQFTERNLCMAAGAFTLS